MICFFVHTLRCTIAVNSSVIRLLVRTRFTAAGTVIVIGWCSDCYQSWALLFLLVALIRRSSLLLKFSATSPPGLVDCSSPVIAALQFCSRDRTRELRHNGALRRNCLRTWIDATEITAFDYADVPCWLLNMEEILYYKASSQLREVSMNFILWSSIRTSLFSNKGNKPIKLTGSPYIQAQGRRLIIDCSENIEFDSPAGVRWCKTGLLVTYGAAWVFLFGGRINIHRIARLCYLSGRHVGGSVTTVASNRCGCTSHLLTRTLDFHFILDARQKNRHDLHVQRTHVK